MAAKKIQTRKLSKNEYKGRWEKALARRDAMERELAAGAGDPALVLAIQGAIAAADALTIFYRGERSGSERHEDAVEIVRRLTELDETKNAVRHLARLLRAKAEIEYTGQLPKAKQVKALADHARRFFEFVQKHLPES